MTQRRAFSREDWITLPNAITVARLLIVVPIVTLLVTDRSPVLTLVLVVVFGFSDWVDGYLARRLGQTSRVGELMDPIADRLGVVVISIALVISSHLPLWIAALILAADLFLTIFYAFHRSAPVQSVNLLGKIRTAVLMVGLILIVIGRIPDSELLALIAVVITAIGAVLHAVTGIGYAAAIRRSAHA